MIQLKELSKIGFGSYRASVKSNENYEALNHALNSGCNLIDTASNYLNGDSEKLVGEVLKANSQKKAFVITKAGYISNDNLQLLTELNKKGKAITDLVDISKDFKHSIHPEYLNEQIDLSLQRLNRKFIDGFLLHSPEYFFEQNKSISDRDEYYRRIKKAFEFLEELVQKKVIRYYGVSSNTLTNLNNEYNSTDLEKLIKIANEVSTTNNFKLIQFPFNILERNASVKKNNNKSVIDIAKEHDIITLANRPFNANDLDGLMRLSIYNDENDLLDSNGDIEIFHNSFKHIEDRLKEIDTECQISDIAILSFISENWMNISNPEAFTRIFHGELYPFLNHIFEEGIPSKVLSLVQKFESIAMKYHQRAATKKVVLYLKSNKLESLLDFNRGNFAENLCEYYHQAGINHILVGMRKSNYVDQLKKSF